MHNEYFYHNEPHNDAPSVSVCLNQPDWEGKAARWERKWSRPNPLLHSATETGRCPPTPPPPAARTCTRSSAPAEPSRAEAPATSPPPVDSTSQPDWQSRRQADPCTWQSMTATFLRESQEKAGNPACHGAEHQGLQQLAAGLPAGRAAEDSPRAMARRASTIRVAVWRACVAGARVHLVVFTVAWDR